MPEPLHARDALDRATESYWFPPSLPQQLEQVQPWGEQESFAIPDLSDDEWDAFTKAIKE